MPAPPAVRVLGAARLAGACGASSVLLSSSSPSSEWSTPAGAWAAFPFPQPRVPAVVVGVVVLLPPRPSTPPRVRMLPVLALLFPEGAAELAEPMSKLCTQPVAPWGVCTLTQGPLRSEVRVTWVLAGICPRLGALSAGDSRSSVERLTTAVWACAALKGTAAAKARPLARAR